MLTLNQLLTLTLQVTDLLDQKMAWAEAQEKSEAKCRSLEEQVGQSSHLTRLWRASRKPTRPSCAPSE